MYSIDRGSDPRLTYKRNLTESITSLDGGAVTRPEQPDLVVATYSGKARKRPQILSPAHIRSPCFSLCFAILPFHDISRALQGLCVL